MSQVDFSVLEANDLLIPVDDGSAAYEIEVIVIGDSSGDADVGGTHAILCKMPKNPKHESFWLNIALPDKTPFRCSLAAKDLIGLRGRARFGTDYRGYLISARPRYVVGGIDLESGRKVSPLAFEPTDEEKQALWEDIGDGSTVKLSTTVLTTTRRSFRVLAAKRDKTTSQLLEELIVRELQAQGVTN